MPDPGLPATRWMYRPINGHEGDDVLAPRGYHRLVATRSPLRPVVPPDAPDRRRIEAIRSASADNAEPTLAAAIYAVYSRLRETHDHLGPSAGRALAYRRLTAASVGQPAAIALRTLLARSEQLAPARTHAAPDQVLTAMIIRWIGHPEHYTDPAATLIPMLGRWNARRSGP